MVLISHKYQFIFTKTFKTGGSTVEKYFQRFCLPEHFANSDFNGFYQGETGLVGKRGSNSPGRKWRSHMSAKEIKDQLDDHIWKDYLKFTIVRNPFTKLISAYFFLKKLENRINWAKKLKNRIKWHIPLWPEFFPPNVEDDPVKDVSNFKRWLKKGAFWDDKPVFTIKGDICVDHVMKFERLEEDMNSICEKLKLPFDPNQVPKAKSAIKPEWAETALFYDNTLIEIVKSKYDFELKNFGYRFPH